MKAERLAPGGPPGREGDQPTRRGGGANPAPPGGRGGSATWSSRGSPPGSPGKSPPDGGVVVYNVQNAPQAQVVSLERLVLPAAFDAFGAADVFHKNQPPFLGDAGRRGGDARRTGKGCGFTGA